MASSDTPEMVLVQPPADWHEETKAEWCAVLVDDDCQELDDPQPVFRQSLEAAWKAGQEIAAKHGVPVYAMDDSGDPIEGYPFPWVDGPDGRPRLAHSQAQDAGLSDKPAAPGDARELWAVVATWSPDYDEFDVAVVAVYATRDLADRHVRLVDRWRGMAAEHWEQPPPWPVLPPGMDAGQVEVKVVRTDLLESLPVSFLPGLSPYPAPMRMTGEELAASPLGWHLAELCPLDRLTDVVVSAPAGRVQSWLVHARLGAGWVLIRAHEGQYGWSSEWKRRSFGHLLSIDRERERLELGGRP
jgi:hypothetical protein